MPIHCNIPTRRVTQSEFKEIDQLVMGCSYEAQNHFGRLLEEQVYENDLKKRLEAKGIQGVFTQVEVWVTHGEFKKLYRLDLVANGMVYELKAVASLLPEHESQALNYAALLNLSLVKLVNFGSPQVTGKLLATPFGETNRMDVMVERSMWKALSLECQTLADQFEEFALDVGGYLEAKLYEEALIHFSGGQEACNRRLEIQREGVILGKHTCHFHADGIAFVVTTEGNQGMFTSHRMQLESLLHALPIWAFQWFNIHHSNITYTTLVK